MQDKLAGKEDVYTTVCCWEMHFITLHILETEEVFTK
jgi:hypothetical protein